MTPSTLLAHRGKLCQFGEIRRSGQVGQPLLLHRRRLPNIRAERIVRDEHTDTIRVSKLGVFLSTIGIFYCYDMAAQRRQRRISSIAKRTNNIVKSLFPKNVQECIIAEAGEEAG